MGNLFAIPEGFEIDNIQPDQRNDMIENYCSMIALADADHHLFYAQDDIYLHTYSFGNITNLIYAEWDKIKCDPQFAGISQCSCQLLCSNISKPLFGKPLTKDEFERTTIEPKAYNGFKNGSENSHNPYVGCMPSWYSWKQLWFCKNQSLIDWHQSKEPFLPCVERIYEILNRELSKYKISSYDALDVCTVFYEKVMSSKAAGKEKEGYINDLGRELCVANYYIYEKEISSHNKNACQWVFESNIQYY